MSNESDMNDYRADALEVVNFIIVYNEEDLEKSNKCKFKPEMAHQIFGEAEVIFGYAGLSIDLYYLHNSSNCFMKIKYATKVENLKADDLVDLLNPWLPTGYVSKVEEFKKIVQSEKHDQVFGKLIHQFKRTAEVISLPGETVTCQYKITQCDPRDEVFQDYHQRFETFIIWFIDAANFIDLNDERWLIYYIYEEYEHPETKDKVVTPIGYTAIYKFYSYPSSYRARISQFFILPTHQRKGLGSELYKTVYNQIMKDLTDVVDITVEEPSPSFQQMRDICDSSHIYEDLKTSKTSLATKSPKMIYNYMAKHKICKRQASRLSDILQFSTALKSSEEEVESFKDRLLNRIQAEVEREFKVHKKARRLMPEEAENPSLLKAESLNARFSSYFTDIKVVAEKLRVLLD